MSKKVDVAVAGATGAVGEVMLEILAEHVKSGAFDVGEVYALASERSAGKRVAYGDKMLTVQDLDKFDFSKVQVGLFSPGGEISAIYAPKAAEAGCVVVDNTSHFRYDDDIPLVVPEVNPEAIAGYKNRGIIANPNCSTIQMLVALKPIMDAVGIGNRADHVRGLPLLPSRHRSSGPFADLPDSDAPRFASTDLR